MLISRRLAGIQQLLMDKKRRFPIYQMLCEPTMQILFVAKVTKQKNQTSTFWKNGLFLLHLESALPLTSVAVVVTTKMTILFYHQDLQLPTAGLMVMPVHVHQRKMLSLPTLASTHHVPGRTRAREVCAKLLAANSWRLEWNPIRPIN